MTVRYETSRPDDILAVADNCMSIGAQNCGIR
jgi:hypothetical protein